MSRGPGAFVLLPGPFLLVCVRLSGTYRGRDYVCSRRHRGSPLPATRGCAYVHAAIVREGRRVFVWCELCRRGASDAPGLPHRRTGRGRMWGRLGGGASDPRDFHGAVAAVAAGQLHCCDVATLRHSLERPRVDVEFFGCFPRGEQHLRFGVINPFCHATIMHDDLDFASQFGPACRNLSDLPLF